MKGLFCFGNSYFISPMRNSLQAAERKMMEEKGKNNGFIKRGKKYEGLLAYSR